MSYADSVLPEFDQEMANTRKVLERIPPDKLDWKIHDKSNTLGWVGSHLANIPSWAELALATDSLDVAPPGGEPWVMPTADSVDAMLESFDRNTAAARSAIAAASDEDFFKPWSLLRGGQVMLTMPRSAVLRGFVISHIIHHRAHLCVYLRMHDVPVPALYGPSADEDGM